MLPTKFETRGHGQKVVRASLIGFLLFSMSVAGIRLCGVITSGPQRLAQVQQTQTYVADGPAFPMTGERQLGTFKEEEFTGISESDRRAFQSVNEALRAYNTEQTENILYRCLPELLSKYGAPLVEQLLRVAPPGFMRETLLRVCGIGWARVDPNAALVWATGLIDASERQQATERVLIATAEVDPEKAVRLAVKSDEAGKAGALTEQLVELWATTDFRKSREWALSLPPGEQRDRCVARVITVEAQTFPADAARFAIKRLPPGSVLDETIISTVYYWARRNKSKALQWVKAFPAGDFRERAMREVNGVE